MAVSSAGSLPRPASLTQRLTRFAFKPFCSATAAIETPGSTVLMVERDGRVVACCQLEHRGDHAYFGMFAVSPTLQGAGLGKRVIAEAERQARLRWGVREMHMTVISVREDLIAWYERRGYRRTGKRTPFPYGDERFGIPYESILDADTGTVQYDFVHAGTITPTAVPTTLVIAADGTIAARVTGALPDASILGTILDDELG